MFRMGVVIAAFAMPLIPTLAEAAKCPSGQIYRVSKKKCQSKALAIKLGIIKPGKVKKSRIRKSRQRKPVRKIAIHRKPAIEAPVSSPAVESPQRPAPTQSVRTEQPATRTTTSQNLSTVRDSAGKESPVSAIASAAPSDKAKPITTRMVKATYFTATPGFQPASSRDSAIVKRAVLNLLKDRLRDHAERNRRMYIDRGALR